MEHYLGSVTQDRWVNPNCVMTWGGDLPVLIDHGDSDVWPDAMPCVPPSHYVAI